MKKETIKIIGKYFENFPEDKKNLELLQKQLKEERSFFTRKNFIGHVVANALIVNNDRVLTVFHNKLRMFIQPGGHVDDTDDSVLEAALREVREETGLSDIVLNSWHEEKGIPVLIEPHLIPEDKNREELEHYHHDFIYIFRANSSEIKLQSNEVSKFEWVKINEVLDKSPKSFIGKTLQRNIDLKIL